MEISEQMIEIEKDLINKYIEQKEKEEIEEMKLDNIKYREQINILKGIEIDNIMMKERIKKYEERENELLKQIMELKSLDMLHEYDIIESID